MTDNDRFDHFLKKFYEILHLHFRHYLPVGKPEPLYYRDAFYELYKIFYSGVLEEISQEPIVSEEVKQLDILTELFAEHSDIMAENQAGTLFDQKGIKE